MNTTAKTVNELQNQCGLLEQQNAELQQQNAELTAKLNWFEEQFRLSQQRRFGRSSEQTHPDQVELFNEAEVEAKPSAEPVMEEITYRRPKKQGQRQEQLKDLPEETIEYRLSPEEQVCAKCGGALHEMSTEVRREIKVIPARSVSSIISVMSTLAAAVNGKISKPLS